LSLSLLTPASLLSPLRPAHPPPAQVYRSIVRATGEEVAVKKMDLESMDCSLEEIVREAQTMRALSHPNLLPLLVSFVEGQHLWMVTPLVRGGSVLNVMRFRFPEGLEEPAIATIMRDVARALEYLHRHGVIHRDVKAGNILLDGDGRVLLADFGVAATLERGGSWGNRLQARSTFVGTPCWMAPEVMQQEEGRGYDARADVWSFGITLLELAHGHAPFARLPPMKVLLMTLQNPPPTLEQPGSKRHFSKAMRDIVARCLQKDPRERPTAAQLLEHKFFKTAHDAHYLQRHVLDGLPPPAARMELLRQAAGGGAGGAPGGPGSAPGGHGAGDGAQEWEIAASQQEYRRGVSAWSFDVAALKAAAAEGAAAEAARLPPIVEGAGPSGSFADAAAAAPASAAASPRRDGGGGSARAGGGAKGRFVVYEGADEPPPFSPPGVNGAGAALMEEAARARAAAATPPPEGGDGAAAGAARKGRFQVVEEERGLQKVGSSASVEAARAAAGAADGPPVTALLPALKEMLEAATLQQEALRELTSAVSDAGRGRFAALNGFLQQRREARAGREEAERLRLEVAEAREEVGRLRARLRASEASSTGAAAEARRRSSAEEARGAA
jgi:serine/threonine-protein kinase OSR1/STK39